MACIYCDFHEHKEQSATSILAAILKQLVAGVEPISEEIKEALGRAKRKTDGMTLRLPEIYKMLIKAISSLRRGFICIDALDEFPTKHRPELWDSLQHIVRECPKIRQFITGRPHIREEIKKIFPRISRAVFYSACRGGYSRVCYYEVKKGPGAGCNGSGTRS